MVRIANSIRLKITVIVFFSTLFTMLISWTISYYFIDKFYVSHTKNSLVSTYAACNEFFNDLDNSIIDYAIESERPYNINYAKQTIIAFVAGLAISCAIIFVMF